MKLIVKKSAIGCCIKHLMRVVNQKSALPILSNILFDVNEQEKTATITAADDAITLTYTVSLDVCEGSGLFCMGAASLNAMLSGAEEQPITFDVDTDCQKITMSSDGGFSFCPIAPTEDWPPLTDIKDDAQTFTLNTEFITHSIKRGLWATSKDDVRIVMNGINLAFNNGRIEAVATDGRVLIVSSGTSETEDMDKECSFIMPKKVAKILPDMLTDESVKLTFDSQQCRIDTTRMHLQFREIEGNFPNYKAIIPSEFLHTVTANRSELLYALNAVSPFAPESSRMVVITFSADNLTLRGECLDTASGAEHSIIEFDGYQGEPLSIGLNASYLSNILSRLISEEVELSFSDQSHALVIKPIAETSETDCTCLIMPMVLTEQWT